MNITWLEDKTLSTFISCLYAEPGFSDVDVNDISEELDIPTKTIRTNRSICRGLCLYY